MMNKNIIVIVIVLVQSTVCFAQSSLYKVYKAAQAISKVYQATHITDEELAEYMRESMKQLDKENEVCGDGDAYTVRLKRITRGMTKVKKTPLNFKVYRNKEANAFASPDGSVRVYSQLMDMMTDDELLGIIGHEIGHIANSDAKDQYRAELLSSAARDGLMMSDGTLGTLAASSLGDVGESMINAKYSRNQELEADAYGYDYLKKCGKDPKAMIKALEKLKKFNGKEYSKYVQNVSVLLSTHPNLDYRIEQLKKRH